MFIRPCSHMDAGNPAHGTETETSSMKVLKHELEIKQEFSVFFFYSMCVSI
jgi:hypothetical protein